MKNLFRVHLPLFLANLIYGINFTVAKIPMPKYIEPLGFIVIRAGVSLILFWIIQLLFIREKIMKRDVPLLILCGLLGVAVNQSLFFMGIKFTTPIHGSLIMIATPILVLIVSRLISKEEVSKQKTAGIILGAAGALLLIITGKKISSGVNTPLGDTFIFINAASYAAYLVIVKPLMVKYNPLTVIAWVFLFGFIFVLPVGYGEFSQIQWHTFPAEVWWAVASVVLGATFLAYLFNIIALKHSSPSVAGIYIYMQPIIATLVAVWFGKDELSWPKVISAVFIFTGVYLVSFSSNKSNKKEVAKV